MSIISRKNRVLASIAVTVTALLATASLVHTGHRARLSEDLEDAVAHDASRVRVIVRGDRNTLRALAERHGVRIKKLLRRGAVLEASSAEIESLSLDPEVDHLAGDLPVTSSLDVTADTIGAAAAWAGIGDLPGLTGRGIGIAVIDSGIAPHSALRGRVVRNVDFWNRRGAGEDQFGHGTHVAGIVGADGASEEGQRFRGVAPGAHLINLRVLGPDGSGDTSDVVDAIDWAIDYRKRYNIRVINLSLGRPATGTYRDDPLCEAVERAVRAGIVVVASAGNAGKAEDGTPIAGGIVSPGNSPYALTVGALNTQKTAWRSDDVVTTYSSRGPTAVDRLMKPDLVAPGNRIVSLEAPGSTLLRNWPAAHMAGEGQNAYFLMSGSSMGTGVVSGAVALLLEANPALDPADVRLALQLTATPVLNATALDAGAGSLNILSALRLATADGGTGGSLEEIPEAVFGGEAVSHSGVSFFGVRLRGPAALPQPMPVGARPGKVYAGKSRGDDDDDGDGDGDDDAGKKWYRPLAPSSGQSGVQGDGRKILWGDGRKILWGDGRKILWGDGRKVIWGDGRRIVWGDGRRIVWGDGKRIVWGDGKRIVWGDGERVVWGDGKRIVWGDGERVVWGDSERVVWGDSALDPWGDR